MTSFVETSAPPRIDTRTFSPAFLGACCLIAYWSCLLLLRLLAFKTISFAPGTPTEDAGFLLTGYITVVVTVFAEIAMFLLASAVVLVGLRVLRQPARAKAVMAALGLAYTPQLLWILGVLSSALGGEGQIFLSEGQLPPAVELLRRVALLATVVSAPELLHRIVGAQRGRAILVIALLVTIVAAIIGVNTL